VSSPITPTDVKFLKYFSILIGILALMAAVFIVVALWIYQDHPAPESPNAMAVVDARVAPVGDSYAGESGRAAMLAADEARKKLAASQVAYGGSTDGKVIYDQLCHACHESGAGGSPKLSDKGAWTARIAQGEETLLKHAIEGFTGKTGIMPARGGNPSLNDAQVKATVEWMMSQVK